MIISDNGTEFTSNVILARAEGMQVKQHCIAPGKPMQNGNREAVNGRMRDELLNVFTSATSGQTESFDRIELLAKTKS